MSGPSTQTLTVKDALERWPFKYGKGPFRIKGVAYSAQAELVASKAPGGLDAVLKMAARSDLREFFEQRFFPSSFYDVFPLSAMGYAHARLMGQNITEYYREMASKQAKHDLRGIYSMLLKVVSPHRAIKGLVGVTNKYHDFGPVSYERLERREAVLNRADFPELLAPWYMPVIEGYAKTVIAQAGGRGAWTEIHLQPTSKKAHELALVNLNIHMGWS